MSQAAAYNIEDISIRGRMLAVLSRRALSRPIAEQTADIADYQAWRDTSLARSWSRFSDDNVNGRDVLDFGCGNGPLSLYLGAEKSPKSITGVDLYPDAIQRAETALSTMPSAPPIPVNFVVGTAEKLPFDDNSFDTVLAFDCLEHVMAPRDIIADWARVLRPGGRVLIEWFPFAGPYGPHMEALLPMPWAHFLFGERAMYEAAEMIYDDPEFTPRHWDLDAAGNKLPNKWRSWRSFEEHGYVNELTTSAFRKMAKDENFKFTRFERHGLFSSKAALAPITGLAARIPLFGELVTSHVIAELQLQ